MIKFNGGGGFYRLVENRPDPDARAGYPSIPTEFVNRLSFSRSVSMCYIITMAAAGCNIF